MQSHSRQLGNQPLLNIHGRRVPLPIVETRVVAFFHFPVTWGMGGVLENGTTPSHLKASMHDFNSGTQNRG